MSHSDHQPANIAGVSMGVVRLQEELQRISERRVCHIHWPHPLGTAMCATAGSVALLQLKL